MANITAAMVKELRDKTGAGMMDCKKALQENDGDVEKAIDFLRKKGIAKAEKKASREVNDGLVDAYIHMGGKLGVLLEVNCETDFVAKTDDFKNFVRDIAMHVAASDPMTVSREEISEDILNREREIFKASALDSGKPEHIVEKIVDGRIEKFFSERVLLEQPYIRDDKKTVKDYLTETIGKLGENITIRRFVRFKIGDE